MNRDLKPPLRFRPVRASSRAVFVAGNLSQHCSTSYFCLCTAMTKPEDVFTRDEITSNHPENLPLGLKALAASIPTQCRGFRSSYNH